MKRNVNCSGRIDEISNKMTGPVPATPLGPRVEIMCSLMVKAACEYVIVVRQGLTSILPGWELTSIGTG